MSAILWLKEVVYFIVIGATAYKTWLNPKLQLKKEFEQKHYELLNKIHDQAIELERIKSSIELQSQIVKMFENHVVDKLPYFAEKTFNP